MSDFLKRLREPSTYAALSAIFLAIQQNMELQMPGAEQVTWLVLAVSILMALLGIGLPEKSKDNP